MRDEQHPAGSYHRDTALAEVLLGRAGHDRLSARRRRLSARRNG
jgi:hypothetical protein